MSEKEQVSSVDDGEQRAWNHFCKTVQLEASERNLLEQQEKVKSVVDFYSVFKELQRKATGDLFDFDNDKAISVLSRARLRKAWLWLEEHPNLIGDAEAFCDAFDSSFVMEDAWKKRKREEAEERRNHKKTLVWNEVPPQALSSATPLFEREEAAKALQEALLPSSGLEWTPVLDHCWGAGKTTLVWRFREILKALEADSSRKPGDDRIQQLYDAVYLNVPFTHQEKAMAASLSSLENDDQFNQAAESIVCAVLLRTLELAASQPLSLPRNVSTMEELIEAIPALQYGPKFFFHFDDVGLFETLSGITGRKMLHCIWAAAEKLRNRRHFFVLTGRLQGDRVSCYGLESSLWNTLDHPTEPS